MLPSRLISNVSAEAGARLLYLATRFFIPPFVLSRIGMEAYGLYGALFVLVAYFGMSAIGFSNAYVKYVAQFAAQGQQQRANRLLSSGFTLMAGIGVAGYMAFLLLWGRLAVWIHVPPRLMADATVLAWLVVGVFFAYLALSVFRDVLTGLQEIAATQKIWIGTFLLETVLIFALVGAGLGLRGLAVAFSLRMLCEVAAQFGMARRRVPWLRVRLMWPDRESLRLLAGFGGIVQVNCMLAIFLNSIERVIATPLIGLGASGLLDLAKRFPGMATSIPSAFATSVLPSAADIHARAESDEAASAQLRCLYLATTRSMNAVSGMLFAFLTFAAAPCLTFWLGRLPEQAVLLTVLFAISSQFHLLTGPGTAIWKASGRPMMEFHYSLTNCAALLLLVPLSRVLCGGWTVAGIAMACAAATVVSALWFLGWTHREIGVDGRTFWKNTLLPGLLPYGTAALCLGPFSDGAAAGSRLWAGASVVILGLLYLGSTAAVLYAVCASGKERESIRSLLRRALGPMTPTLRPPRCQVAGCEPGGTAGNAIRTTVAREQMLCHHRLGSPRRYWL